MIDDNQNNYDRSTIKVGTFFSGIGSPEKALERLKEEKYINDYKLEFFSEIDKNAIKSYCAIHNINEKLNKGSILSIKGQDLPYCDLWIGGFPCQDISNAGKMRGFTFESSTRSSLGWEMIRLLNEVNEKPKYVIFENVANITSKAFKDTLNLFKNDLIKLGYKLYDNILNAIDYGIPQTRKRYFLIAILDNMKNFTFPNPIGCDFIFKDFLDMKVEEKYYLTTNKYETISNNKIKFYNKNRDEIIYEIELDKYKYGGVCGADKHSNFRQSKVIHSSLGYCPTLMASNTTENCKIAISEDDTLENIKIRKITPKEAWKMMGFSDDDYNKASKVCLETNLYHQAGNSIVVDVIYYILKSLL